MSKTSEMEATIRELRGIASSINDIANWLTGAFSGSEEAAPAPEPEKALTLEEVRAILAEKSRDGFTAQIRDLLLKYSAKKLSEVDPASYKALVPDDRPRRPGGFQCHQAQRFQIHHRCLKGSTSDG